MDALDEEMDSEGFFITRNKSVKGVNKPGIVSINDINEYSKNIRINSPRSKIAMNKLGITNEELEFMTFKEYLQKNPQLIGQSKELRKIKYEYTEKLRKKKINQIKIVRNELTDKELATFQRRCLSSKHRTKNIEFESPKKKNSFTSNFTDKENKLFNRMRNINKTELFNRMQLELKKEFVKIIEDQKTKEEKKIQKALEQSLKKKEEENKRKRLIMEEEKIEQEKEKDKYERKQEELRIKNEIELENKHKKKLKLIDKNMKIRRDEDIMVREEFLKNIYSEREMNRILLSQKINNLHEKLDTFLKNYKKGKDILNLKKKNKIQKKRNKVDYNLQRIEYEFELRRIMYEEKEQLKLKEKQQFEKYIKEQEKLNNKSSQDVIDKKEQKRRQTLLNNEKILNKKKEETMNKIENKNKNIQRIHEIRKSELLLKQQKQFEKQLEKEYRVKKIAQLLENRREDIREQLNEKDKKVEEFMKKKRSFIQQKIMKSNEINKEKEKDNEEFEKILSKKNMNKENLNCLKNIIPENKKIDEIICEFNVLLDKNRKTNAEDEY